MTTPEWDDRPPPVWKKWLIRLIFWGVVIGAVVAWPQGVGAVVAGTAILLLALILWVKYKIRKFLAPFRDLDLFPETITLHLQHDATPNNPDAIDAAHQVLEEYGFEQIGAFTINKNTGNYILGFMNAEEAAYAAVYDFHAVDVIVDIVAPYADGSCFTCTNAQLPQVWERAPGQLFERYPGLDPRQLYQKFRRRRPEGLPVTVSAEDFVARFERYHADLMAWNQYLIDQRETAARELREEFLRRSRWSAIDWDRKQNRVVFIHDGLPAHEVVEAYLAALHLEDEREYDRERQRAEALLEEATPMAAFARMVRESPHAVALEKIMDLTTPTPASVYLATADE